MNSGYPVNHEFDDADFARIGAALGAEAHREGAMTWYVLEDKKTSDKLRLEIICGLSTPDSIRKEELNNLIRVITPYNRLQLQGCTGIIYVEEGEVIFWARREGVSSGLAVDRKVYCTLYANVDNRLLSADFTKLSGELIMSSVMLSMAASAEDL